MKAALLVLLYFIGLSVAVVMDTRVVDYEQIVKIRCSLNVEDETLFVFNGSVIAYLTGSPRENRVLFKTVGINVGRCFKRDSTMYSLASRELLYYLDPVTGDIINTWSNPWNSSFTNLTVAHVDNDPVIQNFTSSMTAAVQIYGDSAFLNLDIPLLYPNALSFNATYAPYSPQSQYQAGEFFKFIFPAANLDQNISTVDSAVVSWTREGPFLPWMAMGNTPGHLIYSSSGARIPSWEYLPAQVKADLANRIPHYQHAPTCLPNTASVTSWSFFAKHFSEWLAGFQFPLTKAAVYPCFAGTDISPTSSPTVSPTDTPTSNDGHSARSYSFVAWATTAILAIF